MKKTVYTSLFAGLWLCANAQNPIVPPGMYIADPEAHVWADGKIYIYGSRDESDAYWCSFTHHVLSSSDLKSWDIAENVFASKGSHDAIKAHDNLLFAPDCGYRDGTYYLYFCSPAGKGLKKTGGAAVSDSPTGPFKNGILIDGFNQIDPAVLIDDDGQAYYYCGQQYPRVAKMLPDLLSIDPATIVNPLDKTGTKAFHEGSSIRKIGKLYYFVFADDSRNNRPTCLGYAIGTSPMGPFEYKGILIDNAGSDPSIWNNHGSIQQFKGQWYVFYHRSTNNSRKFRKVCIEPIFINADGTIDEVEMTSQGASGPLDATKQTEGEWACGLTGNVRVALLPPHGPPQEALREIQNGDTAAYKYLAFENGISGFEVKTQGAQNASIEIRLDAPDGALIGTCALTADASGKSYCRVQPVSGTRAVYLNFRNKSDHPFSVDWFRFTPANDGEK